MELEVTHLTPRRWSAILAKFEDASLYQTYALGICSPTDARVEHAVLTAAGQLVAAAQIQQRESLEGCAVVQRGPLWRPRGTSPDPRNLFAMLVLLSKEYTVRRRLTLTVAPAWFETDEPDIGPVLRETGFVGVRRGMGTFLCDLTSEPTHFLAQMRKSWRRNLRKSERNQLNLVQGTDDHLFAVFTDLYHEMRDRKQISEEDDVEGFRAAQALAIPEERMQTIVAYRADVPLAAIVFSGLGVRGISALGATSPGGRKLHASYLLEWRAMEQLRRIGCIEYDLGGAHQGKNPGVYHFKEGLGGQFVRYIGEFKCTP